VYEDIIAVCTNPNPNPTYSSAAESDFGMNEIQYSVLKERKPKKDSQIILKTSPFPALYYNVTKVKPTRIK